MNPQPSEHVGNIGALCVFILFIFYTLKAYANGHSLDLNKIDLIDIAYIEEEPIKKTVSQNFESQQLYLDCIEALYSLGFKKSEAKKKAKLIFSTLDPQPSSIQEFLNIALQKQK